MDGKIDNIVTEHVIILFVTVTSLMLFSYENSE